MTDHWVANLLTPLAFWVLLNCLDDALIDLAGLFSFLWRKRSRDPRHRAPTPAELASVPPRRMAIFVPLWREHRVIQKMIDNNVTKLDYPSFDFFIGAYPNDSITI